MVVGPLFTRRLFFLIAGALLLNACADPPRPDVLVITLDTTRADALGVFGGPSGATPHLDALAQGGARFDEALSPAPLTVPAHAALWTGRYPDRLGLATNDRARLGEAETTLAERLSAVGYHCAAHVAALVLDASFGLDQGFVLYDDAMSAGARGLSVPQRPGAEVIAAAGNTLQLSREDAAPLLLWVHLYDAHEPRTPTPELAARFPPYEAEVAGLDARVGELLETFDRARPGRARIVVVAGDHGESLGEHGEDTHGYFAYRATLRVPLLIAGPGVPPGARVAAPVSLVDVAPTVLDALGLPAMEGADGVSLLPLIRGERADRGPVYSQSLEPRDLFGLAALQAWERPDGWRLIETTRPELYRWRDDPGETRDLAAPEVNRVEALQAELDHFLEGRTVGETATADAAVLSGLEALGYVAPLDAAPPRTDGDLDPKDNAEMARLYFQMSGALSALGSDRAAAALEAFLDRWPEVDAAVPPLVEVYLRLGRKAEARTRLDALAARRPEDPAVGLMLGAVDLAEGRLEDAERRLMAVDTPLLRARQRPLLAALRRAQGRCEEASSLATEAERAGSQDPRIFLVRGACALDRGALAEAEVDLRRVLALDPESRDVLYLLGLAAARAGRMDEALDRFTQQRARTPGEPEVEAAVGRALVALDRPEEAIVPLRAVVDDPRAGDDVPLLLAVALFRTGAPAAQILSLLDEAARRRPTDPQVAPLRAQVQLSARDVDGALRSLSARPAGG